MRRQQAQRRRRRRRRYTLRDNLISALLGVIIAIPLCIAHVNSVEKNEQLRREYVMELIERDRQIERERAAYLAEEQAMWLTYTPEKKTAADYYMHEGIPEEIQLSAYEIGDEYDISPELLMAVAFRESSYDPDAVNGDCTGLMQVSLSWHRDRMERLAVSEADLWEVYPNMLVAADYLRELFEKHKDVDRVLAYYHGESAAKDKDYKASGYVKDVITLAQALTDAREGGDAACKN